jgi:hypothetical protein
VQDLAKRMVDLFSWVQETETLPEKVKPLSCTIKFMVEQVKECAFFIKDYTQQGFLGMQKCHLIPSSSKVLRNYHSLSGRAFKSILSSKVDTTIEEFKSQFTYLHEQFQNGVVVSTFKLLTQTDAMVHSGLDGLRQDLKAHHDQDRKLTFQCVCVLLHSLRDMHRDGESPASYSRHKLSL